jgi:hypothetical protein
MATQGRSIASNFRLQSQVGVVLGATSSASARTQTLPARLENFETRHVDASTGHQRFNSPLSVHNEHLNRMSRGLGKLQIALMASIRRHRKPMTFADIRAQIITDLDLKPNTKLRASFERSLRRALHKLSKKDMLLAIGDGGPSDPFRYFIHPLMIGMMGNTPEAHTLQEALLQDAPRRRCQGPPRHRQQGREAGRRP